MILTNCEEENEKPSVPVNSKSIISSTTNGRTNKFQGCIEVPKRDVTISLWDHGQIDGDIVSFHVNGKQVVSNLTLDGPKNKHTFKTTLAYNGYNYVTLYAHNLGDIPPNTCTVSIDGEEFILESDLSNNGAFDIVVSGYKVYCSSGSESTSSGSTSSGSSGSSSGGSSSSGSSGSTTTSSTGEYSFYTASDLGVGTISVYVEGSYVGTMSHYYSNGPTCGQADVNVTKKPGKYSYTASDEKGGKWSGSFTITAGGCGTTRLTK